MAVMGKLILERCHKRDLLPIFSLDVVNFVTLTSLIVWSLRVVCYHLAQYVFIDFFHPFGAFVHFYLTNIPVAASRWAVFILKAPTDFFLDSVGYFGSICDRWMWFQSCIRFYLCIDDLFIVWFDHLYILIINYLLV